MLIQLPDTIKDLYTVGDVHGGWNVVLYQLRHHKIKNSVTLSLYSAGM